MPLTWKAVYFDGEILPQYNEDGTQNKYKDIERHRLSTFDLIDPQGKTIHRTYIREGQRLIFRRRNFIRLTHQGQEKHTIYLTGWQMTVYTNAGPKNITAINYIYEDGSIGLDDSRNELELLREEI